MQVIVNPAAAGGRLGREWPRVEPLLRATDGAFLMTFTNAPGHATELAAAAAQSGAERIIVAGGDGTLCEAAEGLAAAGGDCEMAILPMGTGNDAARTLGLPREPAAAVRTALDGVSRRVDLIRVGERRILNAIGIGLTGDINDRAVRIKGVRGIGVYLVAAVISLVRFHASPVRLQWDDRSLQSSMAILAVHNGPTTGGGFVLTRGAVPDDGLFDVTLVPDISFAGRVARLVAALRGRLEDKRGTVTIRTARLDLHHDQPLAVHFDGNGGRLDGPVTRFEIVPEALKVVVPG